MPTCLKCKENFPNFIEVNGTIHNLYSRKYCIVCSPFGQNNRRKLHLTEPDYKTCPMCKCNKHKSEFYIKTKAKPNAFSGYCKKCSDKRASNVIYQKKTELVKYKGGKCCICGYQKNQEAMEFHHLNPHIKDFTISHKHYSLEKLKIEADKCILVCRNCHTEIHNGLHSQYGFVIKPEVVNKVLEPSDKTKHCPRCDTIKSISDFYKNHCTKDGLSTWCRQCQNLSDSGRYNKRKETIINYKGNKCVFCGYNKCIKALEFHHKNPSNKEFSISSFHNSNLDALKREIDKCNLLCRNCHAEQHAKKLC
jgi:hypothetical protein